MCYKDLVKRWWRRVLGWWLIFGGIIGLFLPFLQGIVMIFAGLALLGNKKAIAVISKIKKKWQQWRYSMHKKSK